MNSREESAPAKPGESSTSSFPWKRMVIALLLVLGVGFAINRIRAARLPKMTEAEYEMAKSQWDESRPSSYDVTVEVTGMQPGVYEVTVENGIAVAATFDGRALKRQRTFGTWSVAGMFDTLASDLETNQKAGYLMLGAEFDPNFGFPRKYQRIEMRTGAHDALQWEVTRFEPQP